MKKILFYAIGALFLAGCTSKTPSYQKMQINEPQEAINIANSLVQTKTPTMIATQISDSFAANKGAQQDLGAAKLANVTSEGATAIYHFELSSKWSEMSQKNRDNYLKSFQIVLANQACNSPSKRILLRHGVKFSHRFFYDDISEPISSNDVDEAFCQSKGL